MKFEQAQIRHKLVLTTCTSLRKSAVKQGCMHKLKTYDDLHSCLIRTIKVTVDLHGMFWGKQYSVLCINGKYINLYIIGELI